MPATMRAAPKVTRPKNPAEAVAGEPLPLPYLSLRLCPDTVKDLVLASEVRGATLAHRVPS